MEKETEIIDIQTSSTTETFTIYRCGTFHETKKILSRAEASVLYIELHKWLSEDSNSK